MSEDELQRANRSELIGYLESWGFQCYDHETDVQLREAALENFKTEGPHEPPA